MLVDRSLAAFSEEAAARTPTPGGGSVAAYSGCLGAALGTMAARFSEGPAAPEGERERLAADVARLEALRAQLLLLVDADAQAYAGVREAFALPRDDAEQKAARKRAVAAAMATAMEPPRQVCRLAADALDVLDGLRARCNPHLLSDVGVAAWMLGAAHRSAWANVLVNLGGTKDEALASEVRAEGAEIAARVRRLEAAVGGAVLQALGEG